MPPTCELSFHSRLTPSGNDVIDFPERKLRKGHNRLHAPVCESSSIQHFSDIQYSVKAVYTAFALSFTNLEFRLVYVYEFRPVCENIM
jgi:hypothetical protein